MASSSRTYKVALNTLTNYLRFALNILIWFFLTPYMIRVLGQEEFGLWSLVLSVIGFFGLMDLGFGTGVVKFVATSKGSGSIEERNRMISSIGLIYLGLTLVAIVLVGILAVFFNDIFNIPFAQQDKALALLWLIALRFVVISLPFSLFKSVLFGEQRIYVINLVQTCSNLTYGLLAWLFLAKGFGLITLAWIGVWVILVEHLFYLILAWRLVEGFRLSFRLVKKDLIAKATSFSLYTFVVNVAALVLLRTDPIIVKFFMPLSAVALYAVALKITENTHLLTKQFINVLAPLVAELSGGKEEEKVRFVLVNCTKFAFVPAATLMVGSFCLAPEALTFWVGKQFATVSLVLMVLMLAMALAVPQMTASSVLTMTGSHRFTAKAAFLSLLINLAMSLVLVKPLGLLGVSLGTLIAVFIVDMIIVMRKALKIHNISASSYLARIGPQVLIPCLVQAFLTMALKKLFPPTGLLQVVLLAIPGALMYLIVFWFFFVEDSEKDLLWKKVFPGKLRAKENRS